MADWDITPRPRRTPLPAASGRVGPVRAVNTDDMRPPRSGPSDPYASHGADTRFAAARGGSGSAGRRARTGSNVFACQKGEALGCCHLVQPSARADARCIHARRPNAPRRGAGRLDVQAASHPALVGLVAACRQVPGQPGPSRSAVSRGSQVPPLPVSAADSSRDCGTRRYQEPRLPVGAAIRADGSVSSLEAAPARGAARSAGPRSGARRRGCRACRGRPSCVVSRRGRAHC